MFCENVNIAPVDYKYTHNYVWYLYSIVISNSIMIVCTVFSDLTVGQTSDLMASSWEFLKNYLNFGANYRQFF